MTSREKHAAYMKEWRAKQSPEWWENNRNYMAKKRASRSSEQIEKDNAYKRMHYLNNWGHYRALADARLEAIRSDPVQLVAYLEYRRLWKRQRIRGVTTEEWEYLLEMFGHCCAYCAVPFSSTNIPEADHMIPTTQDGPRSFCNVVPSCRRCNLSKGSRHVIKFIFEILMGLEDRYKLEVEK